MIERVLTAGGLFSHGLQWLGTTVGLDGQQAS